MTLTFHLHNRTVSSQSGDTSVHSNIQSLKRSQLCIMCHLYSLGPLTGFLTPFLRRRRERKQEGNRNIAE